MDTDNSLHIVTDRQKDIAKVCKDLGVKKLFVFGSVLTSRFRDESDLDFAVEFKQEGIENLYHNFFDLYEALSAIFNRKIDLVDQKGVRNPFFLNQLLNTRHLIYGSA
ncbi:MAG: nucleotidyltransferase domain-containing protein [Bacteroidales bacterium]|nr:nucleotidyltransferase domain-containing protein [Bacteroidales bacterium]